MKPDEIKIRVRNYADHLIDALFPQQEMFAKLKSATAKYWVKQNIWKLDSILCNFSSENGEIDVEDAIEFYSNALFDENGNFTICLRDVLPHSEITKYMPDKMVIFTRNDLYSLFNLNGYGNDNAINISDVMRNDTKF